MNNDVYEINYLDNNKPNGHILIIMLIIILLVILGFVVFLILKSENDNGFKGFSEYRNFIVEVEYQSKDELYSSFVINKIDMDNELIYIEDTILYSSTNKYWFDFKNDVKYSYDSDYEYWEQKDWDVSGYESFEDYILESYTLFSFIDKVENGEDVEVISDTEYLLTITEDNRENEYTVTFDEDGYLEKAVLDEDEFIYTVSVTDINEVGSLSLPSDINNESEEVKKEELIDVIDDYISNVIVNINSMEYGSLSNSSVLWYIPVSDKTNSTCVLLDGDGRDPFGNWVEAYIVVHYNADTYSYEYYFTFVDDAGYGMLLTKYTDISASSIETSIIEKNNITKQNKIDNIEYDVVVLSVDNGCMVP